MGDAGRWFLLALAAVPVIPSCKDDEPSLEERCHDVISAYLGCYGGYSDAELERYTQEYCGYILEEYAEYGAGCPEAALEIYACISELGCEVEEIDEDACADSFRRAQQLCPQIYGTCLDGAIEIGMGTCGQTAQQCADGKRYEVACTETDMMLECTCSIDGEMAGSYARAGTCTAVDFADRVQAECGFPEHVF
jgi:hypothetical protein